MFVFTVDVDSLSEEYFV